MPNQPPSDRTRAKAGPPVFNRSLSRSIGSLSAADPPATQKNETNPICHPNHPKIRNEHNLAPRHPRIRETNPIFAHSRHRPGFPTPKICETTPNVERSEIRPWRTKQTQSTTPPPSHRPPRAQLCETNPIYRPTTRPPHPNARNEPNFSRGGPVEDQEIRNEPNLSPANYAKRTQFPPTPAIAPASPPPNYAKRTQFPACWTKYGTSRRESTRRRRAAAD